MVSINYSSTTHTDAVVPIKLIMRSYRGNKPVQDTQPSTEGGITEKTDLGIQQNLTAFGVITLCGYVRSSSGPHNEPKGELVLITGATHLDRAVAVDPSCFELLHMRGRFSYQVANLSFFERLAARTMGTLPQVSMDAALKDLLEAEQLRPGITENRLYLGRVLYAKGDYAEAKKWLVE
ncbi:hypothetical protein COOONC_17798, partial [Cooperia oncophora]